jgi:2-dehydropantoate 2-reductase
MHILIVGPGALGGLLASILSMGKSNNDTISLLDYNKARAEEISRQGLRYEKDGKVKKFPVEVFADPKEIDHVDAVFLCVKSYDVEKSLNFCAPLLHRDCLIIFMQNGIAHLSQEKNVGAGKAVFATTTEGSTCYGPGHIFHAGVGSSFLGFRNPPSPEQSNLLTEVVNRMRSGGMTATITESIRTKIWAKLFINVGINALTVIHNCQNGDLLTIPVAQERMRLAIEEAITVAALEKIEVSMPLQDTIAVCRATEKNTSSMLQDVRKQRRTEIDAINGAIVSLAQSHGLAAPINTLLIQQVKEIEKQYETA